MKINQVAQVTGLTTKTIRFYEEKGLLSPLTRELNGYRVYQQKHIDELIMIKRSKLVGFSLEECRALLQLSKNPERKSAEVKQKALEKLQEIEMKINELRLMKETLQPLIDACPGNQEARCPIIDGLSNTR